MEADKTEREAALAREEAFRSEAAEVSAPEYAEGGTPQTAPSAPETKAEETSEKQSLSPEKTESEQETSAKPAPRKGAAETATAPAAPAESKKEEKKEAPAPSREAQSKAESAPTPAEPVKKKPSAPAAETKPETTENIVNMQKFNTRDKYAAFLDGNNGYSTIEGRGTGSILVVKDSYANSFVPYLTENYAKIGVVDFRNFKYGLDSTIEKEGYDEVLVLYNFQTFIADTNLIYISRPSTLS